MTRIIFNENESLKLVRIHKGRQDRAKWFNRKPKWGQDPDACFGDGKIGVWGEGAVAKHFGIFDQWEPGDQPDDDDLAGAEVKAVYAAHRRLIGYKHYPPFRILILVHTELTEPLMRKWFCDIKGWAFNGTIIRPENYIRLVKERPKCHAILQSHPHFRSINELAYYSDLDLIFVKI